MHLAEMRCCRSVRQKENGQELPRDSVGLHRRKRISSMSHASFHRDTPEPGDSRKVPVQRTRSYRLCQPLDQNQYEDEMTDLGNLAAQSGETGNLLPREGLTRISHDDGEAEDRLATIKH